MRITNTDYSPIELLAEIVTQHGTSAADTRRFFHGPRTSHDWLVDEWRDRIEFVLESFKRYGVDANATQHIRDGGIDVRLHVSNHQGREWTLGLQIKSEQEAIRNEKRAADQESMIGTLKRQAFEAFGRVDEWWILCCFDLTKHHRLVQGISSELTAGKRNQPLRVIEPRACAAVLEMDEARVDAICTQILCRDDEILAAARDEALAYNAHVVDFIVENFAAALANDERVSREDVVHYLESAVEEAATERECNQGDTPMDADNDSSELVDEDESYDEDGDQSTNALEMLEALEGSGFLVGGAGDEALRMVPSAFPGLCALYFEARVRHRLGERDAERYVRSLVSI